MNNPSSDLQLGLPEVAKVYMMGSHHRVAGAFEIVFNKGKHDALPVEIKSILRHAALAASTTQLGVAYARYPKDLDEIRKRGVVVVRTGEAVLRAQLAAWDKVIADYSKERFFAKVIASQKAWVKRMQPYLAANNLDVAGGLAPGRRGQRGVELAERCDLGREPASAAECRGQRVIVPGRQIVVNPIWILLERPLDHVALVVEDEDDRLQAVAPHRADVVGRELV